MLWTICEGRCAGDGVGSSSGGYATYDFGEVGDGTEHVLECGVDLVFETVGVFMLGGRSLAIWSSCEIGLRRSIEREEF